MKRFKKQLGQGMTEYIIIVALIAIGGIAAYGLFGDTLRHTVGNMADELSGQKADLSKGQASATAVHTEAAKERRLNNYSGISQGK